MGADIGEENYMNDLNTKTTNHDDIDAEISNTGSDIEEENYDIEQQIGNLQKDIDMKDFNIASMGGEIIMLTKEMNEMKDAREKSEKELEILYEKKATLNGNFCSSCNEPLTQKQTSNKC